MPTRTGDIALQSAQARRGRQFAGSAIAAGILLNPWIVAPWVAADGVLDRPQYVAAVLAVDVFLVVLGLYVLSGKNRAVAILLGVSAATSVLLLVHGIADYRHRVETAAQAEAGGLDLDQRILQRALVLGSSSAATLGMTTVRSLYRLHGQSVSLTFTVPERAVLETATGIDPLITAMLAGSARFHIFVETDETDETAAPATSLLDREVDLSPTAPEDTFRWQDVSLDLSAFEGQQIRLRFEKDYTARTDDRPRPVFDLDPTDLMIWRRPALRPRNLPGRKNVVFVSVDTLRADHLHFAGYERATSPHLDRLAARGVAFGQCISQASWTAPSHHSIFTATYPSVHGATHSGQRLTRGAVAGVDPDTWWDESLPTLASLLQNAGYITAAFTGNGMISARYGFLEGHDSYDHSDLQDGSDVEQVVDKAIAWLNRNQDRTFYLFLHTFEPHWPYVDSHFVDAEGIPASQEMEHMIARYDGDIRRADQHLGRLVGYLEDHGLLENTLLVITSDHGEEFRESIQRGGRRIKDHGHSLYDEILRVPLIFHGLDDAPPGLRVPAQVRSIDIVPTILHDLGLPAPESFQGASLRPLIDGSASESRPAFSEGTTYGPARESLRADGFKYIYRTSYGELTDPQSRGLPLTPRHELYDLSADPQETRNLAPDHPARVESMRQLILRLLPEKDFAEESSAPAAVTDERLVDSLRALGYIE